MRERFTRAKEESDLFDTDDCAVLAAFTMAITHGMAV